jgi:hypothetical protein
MVVPVIGMLRRLGGITLTLSVAGITRRCAMPDLRSTPGAVRPAGPMAATLR